MSDVQWKFRTFRTHFDGLQSLLDEYGRAGWRLHTCDPVLAWGAIGSSEPDFLVVMDMLIPPDEPRISYMDDDSDAMAMKG